MEGKKAVVEVKLGNLQASCFIIMPFMPVYQTLYERVIRPAVEEANLICIRADEVFTKSQITHEIWKQIRECRLVIAELTGKNPNVLYELGLAHAIGKASIIITRNQEDVPFDLKALRYLYYDIDDPFWGENLKTQLTVMCKKVLSQNDFGSILDGISLLGDTTIPAQPLFQIHEEYKFNVSGVWQAKFIPLRPGYDHSWNLHLTQRGGLLSGTLVVSYIFKEMLTVVQEMITGEINKENVSLHGISYSFLEQGKSLSFTLDNFKGKILEEGELMEGEVFDDRASTPIVLHRLTLEKS